MQLSFLDDICETCSFNLSLDEIFTVRVHFCLYQTLPMLLFPFDLKVFS